MFLKYIHDVCVYLYIHNKYTQYTIYIQLLFWMWFITDNHCPAQILKYIQTENYIFYNITIIIVFLSKKMQP